MRSITYGQLLSEVCRVANFFKAEGLVKGDTVAIYMPTIPEAIYTMLACARLGLVHSYALLPRALGVRQGSPIAGLAARC